MSKGFAFIVLVCAISLTGCGASRPVGTGSGAVAMASEPSVTKGIVIDGLYVNKAGIPLCPVTGAAIAKGKEVGKTAYHGVEYHFCCPGCPDDFKSDPAKYAFK